MKLRVLFTTSTLALFSSSAFAQSTHAAAEQMFRDANALLKSGKIHEACASFEESQKLDPQLGTLLNIASCHEKEGKTASAWGAYTELTELARRAGDNRRFDYAKAQAAELEKQLPRVSFDVPTGTDTLKLDGVELGKVAWNVPLPVDPGEHDLSYSGASKKPGAQHFAIAAGETTKVKLAPLVDDTSATTPIANPPDAPPPSRTVVQPDPAHMRTTGGGLRTGGFVVAGLGVVGLGLGATFGVLALGSKSDVNGACIGNQCNPAGLGAADSARTQATISTLGLVAGGVCLAAGIAMIAVGGKKASLTGVIVPTIGGLAAIGTF